MAELNDFLAELPSESAVKKAATESRFESDDDDDSEVDESGVNERMDDGEGVCEDKEKPGEASQMSPSRRERVPRTITDDDGWTTILPRK
ncbi:unnamed protein product [Anisakis simplex]|uniref:Uncharacterized protein n=1 Tax=Anisakis simplex TaxID=6269 RepID=A0A0M3K893_ANISI|nr:unnamed protein product [Anisakis simplex]